MSIASSRRSVTNGVLKITKNIQDRLSGLVSEIAILMGGDPKKSDTTYDPNENYPAMPVGRGVTVRMEWITVEKATEYLSKLNTDLQRGTKSVHLDSMERDVEGRLFRLNGETMIFDWNDRMIDGSHRCTMVCRTGVPILTLVVRGVDPDAYHTINSGAVRSPADALKGLTAANRTALAGALRYVWCWENGVLGYTYHKVSPISTRVTLVNHMDLANSVSATLQAGRVSGTMAGAAFVHYVASKIDRDKADLFFHQLGTGEMIPSDHPAFVLRKRYAGDGMRAIDSVALMIRAWNLAYTDETIQRLQVTGGHGGKTIKFPKFIDDPLGQVEELEIDDEQDEDAA